MTLVYLPDSGLYINPDHVLYVSKNTEYTEQSDQWYSLKFANHSPNILITKKDLSVLTTFTQGEF